MYTNLYNQQFVTHAIPSRITGGVISSGEPSSNVATQTISVPLYIGPAMIVSVCTRRWFSSRSVPGVIPEGKFLPLTTSPSILHLMLLALGCRHLNMAFSPIDFSCIVGMILNSEVKGARYNPIHSLITAQITNLIPVIYLPPIASPESNSSIDTTLTVHVFNPILKSIVE